MNAKQLKKEVGKLFRIRPIAHRTETDGARLPTIDDDWRLDAVFEDPARARIMNLRTMHIVELESDNIQERRSPNFLLLRCQLTLRPAGLDVEPISRGTPIGLPSVRDEFVSTDFPVSSATCMALRAEGNRLVWKRADNEARAVDQEGWLYVEDVDALGAVVHYKIKDPVCDYLVLLMKKEMQ